jgi:hypothetical protein
MQIKTRNNIESTLGASSPAQPAFTLPCPMSMTTADTSSPPNIGQSPALSYFSQGRTDGDGARSSRVFRLPLHVESRSSEEHEVWSAGRRGWSGGGAEGAEGRGVSVQMQCVMLCPPCTLCTLRTSCRASPTMDFVVACVGVGCGCYAKKGEKKLKNSKNLNKNSFLNFVTIYRYNITSLINNILQIHQQCVSILFLS